ncbi:MAG TPA: glycoside hydrolase domain-containing protein, partial [Acidimicrobiales bacterium]
MSEGGILRRRRVAASVVVMALAVGCSALAIPAVGLGSAAPEAGPVIAGSTVTLRGWRGTVPVGWRVVDLDRAPTTCVRWDQPALYVGTPSDQEQCPAHVAGRTQAALVQPIETFAGQVDVTVRGARASGPWPAAAEGRREVYVAEPDAGVVVTGAWRDDQVDLDALLAGATTTPGWTAPTPGPGPTTGSTTGSGARTAVVAPTITSTQFSGLAFDTCRAPSAATMSAWLHSPFRGIGVYIGGMNRGCSQPNLTSAWVGAVTGQGWRLLPIYVGRQAPTNICQCTPITGATAQGRSAALDAVGDAGSLGLPAGTTIYYDMEAYNTDVPGNSSAVVAFLGGWTARLHELGYRSGVYSSSESGVNDIVEAGIWAPSTPDSIWSARWNGAATTADAFIPSSWWPHARAHQYSNETATYGGVKMEVSLDAVDSPLVAASGVTPPPITVPPVPTTAPPPPPTGVPPAVHLVVDPTYARRFVVRIYGLLVGRVPGQSEQDYWTWVIATGGSRAHLVDLLLKSSEWQRYAVATAYSVALQRIPDGDGLAYWEPKLAAGAKPDDVTLSLVSSSERWALDRKTASTWIEGLYNDLLGRAPDAGGEAYWLQQLDDGVTRGAVARVFVWSSVRSSAYVANAYKVVLGFTPTAATIARWTTIYRRTFLPRQILDSFAA